MDYKQYAEKSRLKRFMKMLNEAKEDPEGFGMSVERVQQFEASMRKMVADYKRRYGAR